MLLTSLTSICLMLLLEQLIKLDYVDYTILQLFCKTEVI